MLLAEQVLKSGSSKDVLIFTKWVDSKKLYKSVDNKEKWREQRNISQLIALDDDDKIRFAHLLDGVDRTKLIRPKM